MNLPIDQWGGLKDLKLAIKHEVLGLIEGHEYPNQLFQHRREQDIDGLVMRNRAKNHPKRTGRVYEYERRQFEDHYRYKFWLTGSSRVLLEYSSPDGKVVLNRAHHPFLLKVVESVLLDHSRLKIAQDYIDSQEPVVYNSTQQAYQQQPLEPIFVGSSTWTMDTSLPEVLSNIQNITLN